MLMCFHPFSYQKKRGGCAAHVMFQVKAEASVRGRMFFEQIFSELLHTNTFARLYRWHKIRKRNGSSKQCALTDICTLIMDKES